MTNPISAPVYTPVSGIASDYVGKTTTKPAAKPNDDLGKDTFLKLLVAQLKYQDPSKPADSTQFLSQTAQFSMVEKITALATSQQDLLAAQLQLGASNLIGRTVTYADADSKLVTGVVLSASFTGSTPTLKVGDKDVALSAVKEVRNTPSSNTS